MGGIQADGEGTGGPKIHPAGSAPSPDKGSRSPWGASRGQQLSFPDGSAGKESVCNAEDIGDVFDPWVRKTPWRRKWQPTPLFLPKKSQWTEEPDRPYSPNRHKKLDTTEQLNIHNTGLRFHVFKPLTHIQEAQEKRRCKARPGGVNPVPSKHESVGPWGQDG